MSAVKPTHHRLRDGRDITLRSARVSDAAALLEYTRDVLKNNDFARRESDEFTTTVEQQEELIEEYSKGTGRLWMVADHKSAIVGWAMLCTGATRRLAHCGTLGINLDRLWRGLGLGSLLMERLLDWAQSQPGIEKIGLAVFSTNTAAISLYTKFGFIEEGRRLREVKLAPERYVDEILLYRLVKNGPLGRWGSEPIGRS